MAGSLTVEDLVQGLQGEARHDSAGTFTLDAARAAEKMRNFQLPNPYLYCLKWLQAAVAGGARSFEWDSTSSRICAEIVDWHVPLEQLSRLPTLLFEPGVGRAVRHLAAGLNAVIKTKARSLTVTGWDGRKGLRACWMPGDFRLEEVAGSPAPPKLSIELQRNTQDRLQEWWYAANTFELGEKRGQAQARDREQQLLHAFGGLAPLQLVIQKHQPEPQLNYQVPPSLLDRLVRMIGLQVGEPPYPFRWEEWLPAQGPGGFRPHPRFKSEKSEIHDRSRLCHRYVAMPVRPRTCAMIYPVLDGVILNPLADLEGKSQLVFMVWAEGLTVDLSGFSVVRDPAWARLVAELDQFQKNFQFLK